ncbi:hypothetical protein GEMRC1_001521 [Eukaryota sp. GEM-RC1]
MKLTTSRFSVDLGEIIFHNDITISDCHFDLIDRLSTSVIDHDLPYSSQVIVMDDVLIQSNSSISVPFIFHGSISFHDVTYLFVFSHSTFSYSSSLSSSKHLLIFGTLLVQGKWSEESTLLLNSGTVVFDPSSLFNFTNLDLRSSKVYLLHVPNSINSIVLDNSQLYLQHINHDLFIPFVELKYSKIHLDSIDGQVEIFNLLLISSEFNITNCYPFFVIRVLQTSYSQINLNSGSLSVVENLTNRVDSDFLGNDPYIFLNIYVFDVFTSENSFCCSTFECQVSVLFDHVQFINNFEYFDFQGSSESSYSIHSSSFEVFFSDNSGVDLQFNDILFSFTVNNQFTLINQTIPICPFNVTHLSAPSTFGSDLHVIVQIPSLGIATVSTEHSHFSLSFFVLSGAGCHDIHFLPERRPLYTSTFCYGIPTITDFAPNSLSFTGDFSIIGQNLGIPEFIVLQFENVTDVEYEILSAYHRLIIVHIKSICVTDVQSISLYLLVAGQPSNSISINLHAPSIHVFPEVLPIQGGPFSIYSPRLGQLLVSSCLPYSNLTCDGVSLIYGSSSRDVNRISAEISNYNSSLSEYSCTLQLTPTLITHFQIIIATITSSMDSGVCFIGTTYPTIDLSTLAPQGIRADIVDYTTKFNSTLLTFTPTAIEPIIYLCKYDICFPVSELPPVVQLLDISSSHFVYFGVESVFSFDLQTINLGRYHVDWSDYISISDFQIRFDVLDEEHLRLHLSAVGIGEYSITTFSGISMSTTELKIEIIDALVFPTIFVSSKLVFFYDSMDVVTIFLNDLQFNLYLGYNELNLLDLNNCPPSVIVSADQNYREIELLCQDFSFSGNYSQLLNGLDTFVQLHVPINEGWSYDVSCVKNSECQISEVFSESYLSIVVRFSVSGIGHVLLSITEDRHVSELLVPLEVIPFPVFHLNPLNLSIVYYNGATLSVFISNYVKMGLSTSTTKF